MPRFTEPGSLAEATAGTESLANSEQGQTPAVAKVHVVGAMVLPEVLGPDAVTV